MMKSRRHTYTTSSNEKGGVLIKKKGRCKMSVKIRRSMFKTGNRRFRGKPQRSLAVDNRRLARQINVQRVVNHYPVLEVKDGVAINIDYTNPQHLKWLED